MEGLNSGPRLAADAQFWEELRKEARAGSQHGRRKRSDDAADDYSALQAGFAGECVYFGEQPGVELAERASPGGRGDVRLPDSKNT